MKRLALVPALFVCAFTLFAADAFAQRGQPPAPPPTPRAAAPIDLTGNWVSVVTEDWRWRMLTPPKEDYASVPINAEGRKVAATWDPARAASDGCKAYGAAAIMRVPGRLRIAWESDSILKIETDAGQQTRRLVFGPSSGAGSPGTTSRDDRTKKAAAARSWQGDSVAEWEFLGGRGGAPAGRGQAARPGSLKAVTANLRPGYLRTNGVPYSEDAVVTEHFDRVLSSGSEWLVVLTSVDDPKYLAQPYVTSTHFKLEPDGSKWHPTPCEAKPGP